METTRSTRYVIINLSKLIVEETPPPNAKGAKRSKTPSKGKLPPVDAELQLMKRLNIIILIILNRN